MIRVDSQALQIVGQALKLPISGQAPEVLFQDGVLQQVLDVSELVRRGGALGPTEGMWTAGIVNTHAAADTQSNSVDPYRITAPTAGYPTPVPPGYDVWVTALCVTLGAAGVAGTGFVGIDFPAARAAFGITTSQQLMLAFNGQATLGGVNFASLTNQVLPVARAYRVPRGTSIRFDSTSLIAGTMTARFILGLFPAALGQDLVQ